MFVGTGQGPGLQPYSWGQIGGVENTTLTGQQLPMHTHTAAFTPTGSSFSGQLQAKSGVSSLDLSSDPVAGGYLANCGDQAGTATPVLYAPANSTATAVNLGGVSVSGTVAGSVAVQPAGGSQPVNLVQPYLGIMTIIALQGVWPSRN